MSKAEIIFSQLKDIIVDQLGVEPADVKLNSKFKDDLGADSLDTLEIVMQVEDHFNIIIEDEDALKVLIVQDAVDYLEHLN